MKTMTKKLATVVLLGGLAIGGLSACSAAPTKSQARDAAQNTSQIKDSLEKKNLLKKRDLEENPDTLRYVYITGNTGAIVGYYVAKGKISSSGSQVGPELEVIGRADAPAVVDSAQDDGSYGSGDPGIFFFTADDIMVETSLDYIVSTQPIAVDVPRLLK